MATQLPRIVAADLDGTLLDDDGRISPLTCAVLDQLRCAGVDVVAATGRPARALAALDEVTLFRTAIVQNGAVVLDLHDRAMLSSHPMLASDVARIIHTISETFDAASIAVQTATPEGTDFRADRRFPSVFGDYRRVDIADLAGPDVVRLLAYWPYSCPGHDWLVSNIAAGTVTRSRVDTSEISAAGVTKGTALARYAAEQGVAASEVIAFGNMPNDIEMLRWAGAGIAVANADATVIDAADALAGPNNADGVALYLADLFGLDVLRLASSNFPSLVSGERTRRAT